LAAVIALGFVFASNQGNEVTESAASVRTQTSDDVWTSKIDFLTRQAQMQRASQPTVNIEKYKLEMAGAIGAITPSVSPEAYKALQQQAAKAEVNTYIPSLLVAVPSPVFSPEAARLQLANTGRLQEMWAQRYQDLVDRFEHLSVPTGSGFVNPSVLVTVPSQVISPEAVKYEWANRVRLQEMQEMWAQRYQDMVDRFESRAIQAVSPQGYDDLMDFFAARIAESNAVEEPIRLPLEKHGH
jgi:hypothetical protein